MSRPDPARVASIFEAVVDLAPDEAARLLDRECGDDDALRAEVERLVAHDRGAAPGFLREPPVEVFLEALSSPEPEEEHAPGGHLGSFVVLRKLGEGGMGAVYLAYDEELDRNVALKLLHRGAAARAWLRREGRALGRLAHPNVVAAHGIGEHQGRVFLAMELVEGPSLRAWLDERPRPFAEVLDLLLQAGRGLAAVHEAGLVHRDVKPDNVLIGKDGRARVADLGIAVAGDEDVGVQAGTPAYMAPEQIRGERAGPASDQFAFCVTLYRAVFGDLPFPPDARDDRRWRAPAPPPRRPDVPGWLGPIVRRGLSADPGDRFPSMNALLAEIERHLPRDPDTDPAPVWREQGLIAVAILLLSVVMTAAVWASGPVLAGEWALVRLALVVVAVAVAVVAALWRRLRRNLYGRRVAAIFPGAGLALLLHRVVALRLGTPMLHVLVVDHVLFAALFGATAVSLDRAFAWSALLSVAGAVVSALDPSLAVASFGTLTVVAIALPVFLVARRG